MDFNDDSTFSRHAAKQTAQQASTFGDVLAAADMSTSSAVSTAASNSVGQGWTSSQTIIRQAAPVQRTGGRTVARGAPLFNAPRVDNAWGDDPFANLPAAKGAAARPEPFARDAPRATAASSAIADALREKGTRSLDAGVFDPTLEAREASRAGSPLEPEVLPRSPVRAQLVVAAPAPAEPAPAKLTASAGSVQAPEEGKEDSMPIFPSVPAPGDSRPVSAASPTVALDFFDLRAFVTSPVPMGAGMVQCSIDRERTSMFSTSRLFPSYSLSHKDRFLLAGKKRTYNKTSNYMVTLDKRDLSRESPAFLGKLRSNLVGTEYVIMDDGEAVEARAGGSAPELRQELGVVCYASNVLGSRGPRKMKVAVPKVILPEGKRITFQPAREDDGMLAQFKAGYIQDMFLMINKPPKWNEQVGAYVLNFSGRVTAASVKNFQLVSPDDHDRVVLQFGKTGRDTFTMDFQWPLSPLQAFSICLSSFDYKLACE